MNVCLRVNITSCTIRIVLFLLVVVIICCTTIVHLIEQFCKRHSTSLLLLLYCWFYRFYCNILLPFSLPFFSHCFAINFFFFIFIAVAIYSTFNVDYSQWIFYELWWMTVACYECVLPLFSYNIFSIALIAFVFIF